MTNEEFAREYLWARVEDSEILSTHDWLEVREWLDHNAPILGARITDCISNFITFELEPIE